MGKYKNGKIVFSKRQEKADVDKRIKRSRIVEMIASDFTLYEPDQFIGQLGDLYGKQTADDITKNGVDWDN